MTLGGDRYVEMNVGIIQKPGKDNDWSEDSEPDSPPSPSDRDNSFTSDTDPDSSTGSESDSTDDDNSASPSSGSSLNAGKLRLPGQVPYSQHFILHNLHKGPNKLALYITIITIG
jgi:hypothetical protein